jgi:hypothetical protein
VASSSAAKNDNANQVVGLDSGSGTPTQGSVLRVDGSDTNTQQTQDQGIVPTPTQGSILGVDGSDTNTQQTQDQGVVPTVDIIALEDDDEGEREGE